jgi:RNA polymerase sigma-70 factor (ECF subfamily)
VGESVEENLDLDALRRGNPRAFARMVELHQPIVLGLCQSMGLRGADRDDAAAEVFAAVFRSIARFEGRSALGTWIYRIACRVIPKVRKRYRAGSGHQPDDTRPDPNQETPLEASSRNEINARVWTAVESLDDRSAIVVEMYYRQGMSVEQIGEIIECPSGTVKTLLYRARVRLKELLSRQEIAL